MRRFFAIFICLIYLTSLNLCFAENHLYLIKNASKNDISYEIENAITSSDYVIQRKDPYLSHSRTNMKDYAAIILQPSGNDIYYYFSSSDNKKINTKFLKALSALRINYVESFNNNDIQTFERQAQNVVSNVIPSYNFNEPVVLDDFSLSGYDDDDDDDDVLKGHIITVAKGTVIQTYLQTPINTATANIGDKIVAVLVNDLVYNKHVIAPQGSTLTGTLTKAQKASYGSRNGRVIIDFNTLTTPEGKTFKVSTEAVDFSVTNDGKLASVAGKVATGAILGLLGGLLVAALSSDKSTAAAVLIGAGAGAAGGAVTSVAERGVDAEIPVYTQLDITLSKSFKAVIQY